MELIKSIRYVEDLVNDDLDDVNNEIINFKIRLDKCINIRSSEVINFFFENSRDLFQSEEIFYNEINKLFLKKKTDLSKTNFKFLNDMITLKKKFFSKNKFILHFLNITNNLEKTIFYIAIKKAKNYNDLCIFWEQFNSSNFCDFINVLKNILIKEISKNNLLSNNDIKTPIELEDKHIEIVDRVNLFFKEKIQKKDLNNFVFLESKLNELMESKKIKEIQDKTNTINLEYSSLEKLMKEISENDSKINEFEKEIKNMDDKILKINNEINNSHFRIKLENINSSLEISDYNSQIQKKEYELVEIKKNNKEELDHLNLELKKCELKKVEIEDDTKVIFLQEKIKSTFNKDEVKNFEIELEEIINNKYIDILINDNKVEKIKSKITDLEDDNINLYEQEIKKLKKVRNEIDKSKKNNEILEKRKSIKKITEDKKIISEHLKELKNVSKALNLKYQNKDKIFSKKKLEFVNSNQKLLDEINNLNNTIQDFKKYIEILKTNFFNLKNNNKIIIDILQNNIDDYKSNSDIIFPELNKFGSFMQDILVEIKSYILDIKQFRYYENLIYELCDLTNNCDENINSFVKNIKEYNFINNLNIKPINHHKKINDLIQEYEKEFFELENSNLHVFTSKKKYLVTVKENLSKVKTDLKFLKLIQCD